MSSWEKTNQAVEGTPSGGCRATSFKFLMVLAFFWASVKTFRFDCVFGFRLAFAFAGFRFALERGFAVDFAEGLALAEVLFGAGFFAALVFEVVGAFRGAVVVRPVCALGRDAGLVA